MKLSIVLLTVIYSVLVDAITLTTSSASYTVNAGSSNPLEVVVSKTSCDITSLKYRGTQVQYGSQGSHIGSGLGSATVTAQQLTSKISNIANSKNMALTEFQVAQHNS